MVYTVNFYSVNSIWIASAIWAHHVDKCQWSRMVTTQKLFSVIRARTTRRACEKFSLEHIIILIEGQCASEIEKLIWKDPFESSHRRGDLPKCGPHCQCSPCWLKQFSVKTIWEDLDFGHSETFKVQLLYLWVYTILVLSIACGRFRFGLIQIV